MPKTREGRRILIVEDELLIAMEVQDLLSDLGAEVVGPFGHLKPALDAVHREPLHGAVLDVRLDGETIQDIAEMLVGLNQSAPAMAQAEIAAVDLHNRLREREGRCETAVDRGNVSMRAPFSRQAAGKMRIARRFRERRGREPVKHRATAR